MACDSATCQRPVLFEAPVTLECSCKTNKLHPTCLLYERVNHREACEITGCECGSGAYIAPCCKKAFHSRTAASATPSLLTFQVDWSAASHHWQTTWSTVANDIMTSFILNLSIAYAVMRLLVTLAHLSVVFVLCCAGLVLLCWALYETIALEDRGRISAVAQGISCFIIVIFEVVSLALGPLSTENFLFLPISAVLCFVLARRPAAMIHRLRRQTTVWSPA